jgi:O-acetyl-ADP-ribose deacetylase (regulator of RNase III)
MMSQIPATISVEDIPTLTQLYQENRISPLSKTDLIPNKPFNDRVCLIEGDITHLKVDAIVNAAKNSLLGGGGIDGAIHRAAGRGLRNECSGLGGCNTGQAKITRSYNLPCKRVIHTVGPVYKGKDQQECRRLLKQCYTDCLELAVQNDCKSIVFCCISTGVYGYPNPDAAAVAVASVREFLEEDEHEDRLSVDKIVFCCFNGNTKDIEAYSEFLS